MRILIACEESQAVCIEFRKLGFEAFSCDILPCSGGHPEWHLQQDVTELLKQHWDLIIAFPPCTYVCFAGIRWNTNNPEREQKTVEAVEFFKSIINANCNYIAIENPVGVIPKRTGLKWAQIIHPWEFGDPQEKKTCIWLKNLPLLKPSNIVTEREQKIFRKSALGGPGTSKFRSFYRSKTFPGIAKAMADQWGYYLLASDIL